MDKILPKIILISLGFFLIIAVCMYVDVTTTATAPASKYPAYTPSQAKLLIETGKCKLSKPNSPDGLHRGYGNSRSYETRNKAELYNAIDTYVELDGANAFEIESSKINVNSYRFTTMVCSE